MNTGSARTVLDAATITAAWVEWVKPIEAKLGPMPAGMRDMNEQAFFMGALVAAALIQGGIPIEKVFEEIGVRAASKNAAPLSMVQ